MEEKASKEGQSLLGKPKFKKLENGRFRCVETGHELPSKEIESYGQSKRCRLGLIDHALKKKKPPHSLFEQDPFSGSKLVCQLTGDTINKSEEHIWKHINGKRFLSKLEEMEEGKNLTVAKKDEQVALGESKLNEHRGKDKKKNKKKNEIKLTDECAVIVAKTLEASRKEGDVEDVDFWMPPEGNRWDFDDGGDRWGSDSDSGRESEEDSPLSDGVDEEGATESTEISTRMKRMSVELEPSSSVTKKKRKTETDS